jgi:hypothetical protein
MSGIWGWFGGGSAASKKDAPKNAILGLRSQLDMLQKRERHLQSQMDEQDQIARKNVSTNKNGMFHFRIAFSKPRHYSLARYTGTAWDEH